MVRVEFLGGVRTVTGSATLFEKGSLKWLVDCGMFQGGKEIERKNYNTASYHPRDLSFILLTHAHIDHSGLIPKLVREGFRGKVICTKVTFDLCEVMFRDSGHIQEMEAEWQNRKNRRSGKQGTAPLYTVKDAEKSLRFFSPVEYNEMISLNDGLKVRFQDAGHILGSAIIELWVEEGGEEKKLVFSGDLGNSGQPIVKDPSWVREADSLWLESTYGNRLHKSKEETAQELLKIVQEAIGHQAKVIIPAFALERTQAIIYTLGQFMRDGHLSSIPVYIDSPLAISAK
ncbi:MAG: MBL fold metallo-hydrolase, partial [Deltaproteobacteria bacterium]|nr:MBL fold metallo-hydrolase [Deltaproteobacteria bacterium]